MCVVISECARSVALLMRAFGREDASWLLASRSQDAAAAYDRSCSSLKTRSDEFSAILCGPCFAVGCIGAEVEAGDALDSAWLPSASERGSSTTPLEMPCKVWIQTLSHSSFYQGDIHDSSRCISVARQVSSALQRPSLPRLHRSGLRMSSASAALIRDLQHGR